MDTKHEFDTPFLTEELFSPDTGSEKWKERASAFAADSPFQSAFELLEESGELEDIDEPASLEDEVFLEGERRRVVKERRAVTKGPVHIRTTTAVPWRWICNVALYKRSDVESRGTGILITDRHVLTAAHVVDRAATDPAVYRLRVTPALNDGRTPFDSYGVDKVKIPPGYQKALKAGRSALIENKTSWAFDYALLTLNERAGKETSAVPGNNALCYWGHPNCGVGTVFTAVHATDVMGRWAVTAGYPERKGGTQLWSAAGPVHLIKPGQRTMLFDAPTGKGWSGSPVWLVRNRMRCLVGIVVRAHAIDGKITQATAVRITQDFVRQIVTWILEDKDKPAWRASCPPDRKTKIRKELEEQYNIPPLTEPYGEDEWTVPEQLEESAEPDGEEEDSSADEYHQDDLEESDEEDPGEESDEEYMDQQVHAPDNDAGRPFFVRMTEALRKSDWAGALKLAIDEGTHDETELTNLLFFFRHPALKNHKLDPKHPDFKELSKAWARIRDREVVPVIQRIAQNPTLAVTGKQVSESDRYFRGARGKRFKTLVENAAKEVGVHPALLAAILLAESRHGVEPYLRNGKVDSYEIGADYYYLELDLIKKRIPAHARVDWDRTQIPRTHPNDARRPKNVKSIWFDSGPDGVLAGAVYTKHAEIMLRNFARKHGGDFDRLPLEARWALTRIGYNAGAGQVESRVVKAVKGEDFLIRDWSDRKKFNTDRNAAIHTARAIHFADWIFGKSVDPASTKPEHESPDDAEQFELADYDDELEMEASVEDYESAEEVDLAESCSCSDEEETEDPDQWSRQGFVDRG